MNEIDKTIEGKFYIGQVIQHKLFDYRGVIVDVDSKFEGSEEWYEAVAQSRPPKEKPWYHILPDGSAHKTYVAERNIENDKSGKPIEHPAVGAFFSGFKDGTYITNKGFN
ncbi:MAG TPA: heat shock protein HspQ [Thermodesulfobacteriota bacterium]|nr:heat shock protein HspQ [Thermodesulfobacteriota bacterium]